jgi:undecaprenyl-diphosphatase
MKKKALWIVLGCMLINCLHLSAESRYTYDVKTDLILGPLSLGLFITPFFMDNRPVDTAFNRDEVNGFDRPLMFAYNETGDMISKVGAYALLVLPAVSLLENIGDLNTVLTYGIMYAEAFFLTYGTKELLKHTVNRNRPYNYFDPIPDGMEDDYFNSFPSGHTSLAFMAAGFLTATFSAEYPASPWKGPVIGVAYSLAAGVGAGRILSGDHFLTDVLAGAAIGSLYGYLVPALHRKKNNSNGVGNTVTLIPVLNGLVVQVKL